MAKRKHPRRIFSGRKLAEAMTASRDLKTQSALARKSGIAQSTIGRILRGEVDPQIDTVDRLANALGILTAALLEEAPDIGARSERKAPLERNSRERKVPLISWIQAGDFAESIDTYQPGDAERWLLCPVACGPKTFALRVEGESMQPSFQTGDIIFVDPDVPESNGKNVVVRLDDRNEVTFKRLVMEDGQKILRPLNSNWKPQLIPIPADARIVGVVIGKWVDA